jgi:hypothetical protein
MEQAACKHCGGTGVISVPGGSGLPEAAVACSCDVGNAFWTRVLEIVNTTQNEAKQKPIGSVNEQLRARFQEQKIQANNATDTVRTTLNAPRGGKPSDISIKIWESKK